MALLNGPAGWALTFELWLGIALAVVAAVLEIWALIDCLTRSSDSFIRVGERSKGFWLTLTGIAAAVGVLIALLSFTRGGFGLLGIIALCIACVYLAGPRRKMSPSAAGGGYY